MNPLPGNWENIVNIGHRSFECGFCGEKTGVREGYKNDHGNPRIFICGGCNRPTYFEDKNIQTPTPVLGNNVDHLPELVNSLYSEARRCTQINSYTACVLTCRKLLMHVAVEKGAEEGISFIKYVEYLSTNHYIPPDGKQWVDQIRKKGNEANHAIVLMKKEDAFELLSFIEMLLKFVYEFPARILPNG